MNIKKHAGKGNEKGKGKRKAKKTAEILPPFSPFFFFSSLLLPLLPPFPAQIKGDEQAADATAAIEKGMNSFELGVDQGNFDQLRQVVVLISGLNKY